jgi:hypothetical protein
MITTLSVTCYNVLSKVLALGGKKKFRSMRYLMNFFGHVDIGLRVTNQGMSLGCCYEFTEYVDDLGGPCPHQQYWEQGFSTSEITQRL